MDAAGADFPSSSGNGRRLFQHTDRSQIHGIVAERKTETRPADVQTKMKLPGLKKLFQTGADRVENKSIVDDIFRKKPDFQFAVQMIPESFGKSRTAAPQEQLIAPESPGKGVVTDTFPLLIEKTKFHTARPVDILVLERLILRNVLQKQVQMQFSRRSAEKKTSSHAISRMNECSSRLLRQNRKAVRRWIHRKNPVEFPAGKKCQLGAFKTAGFIPAP